MVQSPNNSGELLVTAYGVSDVGRKRERNEDAMHWDGNIHLYLVADGMGGHAGGGMASRMAVEVIRTVIQRHVQDPDATNDDNAGPSVNDPESMLRHAIEVASQKIYLRSVQEPHLRGMGTTVVALWLRGSHAYVANVGDSRGYLIRKGEMHQLTVDHSLVGEQLRAGILSETDARRHRLKNIITRSVGFQDTVDIDIVRRSIRPGDLFLLCSDGLTNMVDNDEILAMVKTADLQQVAQTLIDRANANGGEDNITLLFVRAERVAGKDQTEDPDATEEWEESTVQL